MVLYDSETSSLTYRKEGRLREFKNKVPIIISFSPDFGSNKEKGTGGWRQFYSQGLHKLHLHRMMKLWTLTHDLDEK
jgi:hypothetical protein